MYNKIFSATEAMYSHVLTAVQVMFNIRVYHTLYEESPSLSTCHSGFSEFRLTRAPSCEESNVPLIIDLQLATPNAKARAQTPSAINVLIVTIYINASQ